MKIFSPFVLVVLYAWPAFSLGLLDKTEIYNNYFSAKHCNFVIGDIGYNSKGTFEVRTARELVAALVAAKSGDIIYIADGASIDLSGFKNIEVREGITIKGSGTKNGTKGPLLFTNSNGIHPLFNVIGDNVKFIGLKIKGADGQIFYNGIDAFAGVSIPDQKKRYLELYNKNMYATPVSSAIATKRKNLLIDNCELSCWTYTAVYVQKGAENATVKNSFIHDNQRFGLGYGVTIDQGEAYIYNNTFNRNRHSVASTGRAGSCYTVENNIFYQDGNNSWAVDMHGGVDRNDGSNLAGKYVVVRNNIFYLTNKGQAVVLRGKPSKKSIIEGNRVYRDKKSTISKDRIFEQRNSKGNFEVKNNSVQ